jgi:hypothetical protein
MMITSWAAKNLNVGDQTLAGGTENGVAVERASRRLGGFPTIPIRMRQRSTLSGACNC